MTSANDKKRSAAKMPLGAYEPPPPPDAFDRRQPATRKAAAAEDNSILHDLFSQQMRTMLDRTDLDEEQKQGILVAMNCPCCGAGGLSFTAKVKRRT